MLSANNSKHSIVSALKAIGVIDLQQNLQNWIRKEIVDDDPCDVETYFPEVSQTSSQNSKLLE